MLKSHLRSEVAVLERRRQYEYVSVREAGMNGHRILIVDDDEMNAKVLRFVLHEEGYETNIATTIVEARRLLDDELIDLVISEMDLLDGSGLSLCEQVRREYRLPFIFVSSSTTVKDKIDGFRAGAEEYIVKPYEPAEVAIRIWSLLRRTSDRAPNEVLVRTNDLELDSVGGKVTLLRNNQTIMLTSKESTLLHYLVSNPNRTMTRDALMIRVWGYGYDSTNNQLDVYISRLRNKIEERPSSPKLLLTVRGVGYRYQPSDQPQRPS